MDKKVIYSGIQPTGRITLGNYIGAVSNWIRLQDDDNYLKIYSVVDLHSLTVRQVPSELRARSLSFFAQYMAMGLDPDKNIIYFQSHVHEHTELTWILNCLTYIGEASRMSQFKDKSAKHADNINMGLMDYPVLMAADILLYNTALVPIGIDQKQHLELARDLAQRFNSQYSPTFTVPEPYINTLGAKIMSLQDPISKMSKSDCNEIATIYVLDEPDVIMRKIRRAVTDSDGDIRFDIENKPGVSNLLTIMATCKGISIEAAAKECQGMNYGEFKDAVGETIVSILAQTQNKYKELIADKDYLLKVAKQGAEQASAIASKTLRKVYKKVGLVQL